MRCPRAPTAVSRCLPDGDIRVVRRSLACPRGVDAPELPASLLGRLCSYPGAKAAAPVSLHLMLRLNPVPIKGSPAISVIPR